MAKRAGSSISRDVAERDDGADTGHRHQAPADGVIARLIADQLVEAGELLGELVPGSQDRVDRRHEHRMGGDELAHGIAPPLAQQSRRSEAEATQQTPDAVVEIPRPPDQGVAGTEQNPPLAGASRLHVHRPEPAHPQQLGDAASVAAIGLHLRGLERRPNLPGLHEHSLETMVRQASVQPLRHRPGFQPDATWRVRRQGSSDRIGVGRYRALEDDATLVVDHTDRGGLQRHVQSCKVLQSWSSSPSAPAELARVRAR